VAAGRTRHPLIAAPTSYTGPVVVGGLGGSGTRAIAEAFARAGIFMGSQLNPSHDHLCFTLLCKRPRWLPERLLGPRPSTEIIEALDVMERLMTGRPLDRAQLRILADAAADMASWGHDADGAMRGSAGFRIAADAIDSTPPAPGWWGWKEPNSHLVLPELVAAFPDLRYVHVLRHPLDMAFAANVNQLVTWGPSFGIRAESDREVARANSQLAWWLASTAMALETGRNLGRRFAVLRFEDFCRDPAGLLTDTLKELEIDLGAGAAVEHVKPPASTGRWRDHPWTELDPELLERARGLGYHVPTTGR
jgi:hypothetical protein